MGAQLDSTLLGRLEAQTYVTSGYLATLAAFLVLAGALGDYYGRRRMFRIGLVGFGLTSVLCGLAPNLELLVLGRVLQGVAGALLVPGSLSIITSTFEGAAPGARVRRLGGGDVRARDARAADRRDPGRRRGLARAVPDQRAARRSSRSLATRYMDESRDETATGHFDWLGAFVAVLAVGGLAFGATRGQQRQWEDPIAFVALAIGAVALVAFPILMARGEAPARAARAVPAALVRDDQPVDAADLRRAVRERRLPGAVPAEHARLHAARRGDRRAADRDPADAPVDPRRRRSRGGSAFGRSSSPGRSSWRPARCGG